MPQNIKKIKLNKVTWSYSCNVRNTGPQGWKDLQRSQLRARPLRLAFFPPAPLPPRTTPLLFSLFHILFLKFLSRATWAQLLLSLIKTHVTSDACNDISVVLAWEHWQMRPWPSLDKLVGEARGPRYTSRHGMQWNPNSLPSSQARSFWKVKAGWGPRYLSIFIGLNWKIRKGE